LLLFHLYLYNTEHIKKIDYTFYDFTTTFFQQFQKSESGSYTVIVDIDEKSLYQLGQWPWPRVIDAELIDKINKMSPVAIGINILFPEKDRVSPIYIEEFYRNFFNLEVKIDSFPEKFRDNDRLLSQAIERSNVTLSTYFNNGCYTNLHCRKLSYKDNIFSKVDTELLANSLLCNYKILQNL
jgi:adenylate cyclase